MRVDNVRHYDRPCCRRSQMVFRARSRQPDSTRSRWYYRAKTRTGSASTVNRIGLQDTRGEYFRRSRRVSTSTDECPGDAMRRPLDPKQRAARRVLLSAAASRYSYAKSADASTTTRHERAKHARYACVRLGGCLGTRAQVRACAYAYDARVRTTRANERRAFPSSKRNAR